MANRQTDFLIVTPLAEERDAILERLPNHQQAPPSRVDIRVYYNAELVVIDSHRRPDSRYCVVVLPLSKMGHTEAANATSDAIRRWKPRYVVLVGIAGGLAEAGVKLGDVLVGDQIVNFEQQKVREKSTEIRWQVHQVDPRLLIACQNFKTTKWHETGNKRYNSAKPEVHFGHICTGNKVIARTKLAMELGEIWAKLVGFEMEAGGAVEAVFQSANKPGFFMIRGVSDLADGKKDSAAVKRWRRYACEIAAAFTIEFLRSAPVPVNSVKRTKSKRSSRDPKSNKRSEISVETLAALPAALFEKLVFKLDTMHAVPGRESPQSIRAMELIRMTRATNKLAALKKELSILQRA